MCYGGITLEAMTEVNADVLGSWGRKTPREMKGKVGIKSGEVSRTDGHSRLTLKDKQELSRSRDGRERCFRGWCYSHGGVEDLEHCGSALHFPSG